MLAFILLIIETAGQDGATQQWWDNERVRHVPKRSLDDIIMGYLKS